MEIISNYYQQLAKDSLFRNSIFLMLSTGVMAFLGFFFWIINARLFSSEQVGIATTLISVVALIASFSSLGLGTSLVRYLPISKSKNETINTTFTLICIASIVGALFFLINVKFISPTLTFIKDDVILSLLFILFVVASALNQNSESIFIAYRSSKYVLIKTILLSVVKLALPIFLITFGAYGIFMSVGISYAVGFAFTLLLLILKFNYFLKLTINGSIIKKLFKFSLGNYIAGFIGGLPAMVLPILILNSIGAKFSAYFYMDMMIASLLYSIPMAVSQSLFAEGSRSENYLKAHLKKTVKIIALLLIPSITITILFGKYILLAFGKEYSSEGVIFLQLLALSGIFVSINYIGNSIFYIKHKVSLLIFLNIINAFLIISLSLLFIKTNLHGVGVGWLIGEAITSLIYLIILWKYNFFINKSSAKKTI